MLWLINTPHSLATAKAEHLVITMVRLVQNMLCRLAYQT